MRIIFFNKDGVLAEMSGPTSVEEINATTELLEYENDCKVSVKIIEPSQKLLTDEECRELLTNNVKFSHPL